MDSYQYPVLVHDDEMSVASLAPSSYQHYFGGPLALTLKNFSSKQGTLHRLLTIYLTDSLLNLEIPELSQLPLLYGFMFDGCQLSYKVLDDSTVEILSLEPTEISSDWPYENYPEQFQEQPVTFATPQKLSEKEWQNLTWQGLPEKTSEKLYVIVPPSQHYGVSLWGEMGDAEGVQVVFTIDLATQIISVENQCE